VVTGLEQVGAEVLDETLYCDRRRAAPDVFTNGGKGSVPNAIKLPVLLG
jgi:hypothetical protein